MSDNSTPRNGLKGKGVTLRFYAILRLKLGITHLRVRAETVAGALARAREAIDEGGRDILFEGEYLRGGYAVLLRGRRVSRGEFKDTPLVEGDALHVFPPVGGG